MLRLSLVLCVLTACGSSDEYGWTWNRQPSADELQACVAQMRQIAKARPKVAQLLVDEPARITVIALGDSAQAFAFPGSYAGSAAEHIPLSPIPQSKEGVVRAPNRVVASDSEFEVVATALLIAAKHCVAPDAITIESPHMWYEWDRGLLLYENATGERINDAPPRTRVSLWTAHGIALLWLVFAFVADKRAKRRRLLPYPRPREVEVPAVSVPSATAVTYAIDRQKLALALARREIARARWRVAMLRSIGRVARWIFGAYATIALFAASLEVGMWGDELASLLVMIAISEACANAHWWVLFGARFRVRNVSDGERALRLEPDGLVVTANGAEHAVSWTALAAVDLVEAHALVRFQPALLVAIPQNAKTIPIVSLIIDAARRHGAALGAQE
ncbi:MAG: hypothetical protein IT381_20170 [Deltaproteobacteria bacterium]|nr:hypothetical protein [Deltaproteobacteria bacterium]